MDFYEMVNGTDAMEISPSIAKNLALALAEILELGERYEISVSDVYLVKIPGDRRECNYQLKVKFSLPGRVE